VIHVKQQRDTLRRFSARAGLSLAEPQMDQILRFTGLLVSRAVPLGLVSRSDSSRLLERHVLDSLRASSVISDRDRKVADLGSGAGLPGVVLAVSFPQSSVTLIEPRERAAGFLELVADRLGLSNVTIAMVPAEDVAAGMAVDVVTARAFGPLQRSWAVAWPILRSGGRMVYFAGRRMARPEETARSIRRPQPAAAVDLARGLESSTPLVIMTRRR
jgi:16S rRNA (guanine527-N7)-methyltransferase